MAVVQHKLKRFSVVFRQFFGTDLNQKDFLCVRCALKAHVVRLL